MIELKHKTFGSMGRPQNVEQQQPEIMEEVDLRSLIELGCIKKDVEIDGLIFKIKSLNTEERRHLLELTKQNNENANPENSLQTETILSNILLATVAMSIESVNGKPLEVLYEGKETDSLYKKMEIISKMQLSVISKLLTECQDVLSRSDNKFTTEQIKNS